MESDTGNMRSKGEKVGILTLKRTREKSDHDVLKNI